MSIASGDTPADPLTEGGDGTRRPPGEGGDGGAGVGGPGDGGPEQPVLEQVVGEPVLAGGVQMGHGAEAETQSDPKEPWWLWTPPWGPPPEFRPGVYPEAQTEEPAMRARVEAPPWWLREPPPHWALPHPMAAGREPA
jgi:hypothetical protein